MELITFGTSRFGPSNGPNGKKIHPHPKLKWRSRAISSNLLCNATLARLWVVEGASRVPRSVHTLLFQVCSAQVPAQTARSPPAFANASTSSILDNSHLLFSDEVQ